MSQSKFSEWKARACVYCHHHLFVDDTKRSVEDIKTRVADRLKSFKSELPADVEKILLEQYKMLYTNLCSFTERRWKQHSFFTTICMGIIAANVLLWDKNMGAALLLTLFAAFLVLFWLILHSNLVAKSREQFAIMTVIESHLPVELFYKDIKLQKTQEYEPVEKRQSRLHHIFEEMFICGFFILFCILTVVNFIGWRSQ